MSIKRVFSAVVLLAALASAAARADGITAGRPITAEQYRAGMALVERATDAAAGAGAGADQSARAERTLQPLLRCVVRTTAGDLVFVDNRPLLAQMQGADLSRDAADRAARWSEISFEIAQIVSASRSPAASVPSQRIGALKDLLTSPEFSSDPIPGRSVWDRLGDWIAEQLRKIHWPHPASVPDVTVSPQVPDVILICLGALAIGLIVYFGVRWWLSRQARVRDESLRDSGLAMSFEERELVASHNFARLRELANDAAQRGDFRSAFRLTFLALLVYLDAEGAIKLDRSKTNWEYLRSLGGYADLRAELQPFVTDFDRIWYGEEPASARDFERAGARYDSARAVVATWQAGAAASAGERRASAA